MSHTFTHNLESFQQFARSSKGTAVASAKKAVIYTRVSSKEQADKNLSLDFQMKTIMDYATKNSFEVAGYFGGTYESAKTDGRKEFTRMLDFIKKHKGLVSHVLVYTLDRFSRTGGGAIKLAQDLREQYGVTVFAVTQPTDTTNVSGVFQQNIQFLFSEFDNQLRRQRAVAGTREKLERGIWCLKPPIGYDVVRINGERKIVINKQGEWIRKAFQWKLQGEKSEAIIAKLRRAGLKMYKQKFSQTIANPFYCGVLVNKMLGGKLVKGTHPAIVSEKDFLVVNDIRQHAPKYGVSHLKEVDQLPLKVFMKCEACGDRYTGYIVKSKNIYYYKCRTKGCKCNQNAGEVNKRFEQWLAGYTIREEYIAPLQLQMSKVFEQMNRGSEAELNALKGQLADTKKKLETIEEKYFVLEEMEQATYQKFKEKYAAQKREIERSISLLGNGSSNLASYLNAALLLSSKLPSVWASSPIPVKEKLQKVLFPEGIIYDRREEAFRTEKVNEVFGWIAGQERVSGDSEKKQPTHLSGLSNRVGTTGFEPATP